MPKKKQKTEVKVYPVTKEEKLAKLKVLMREQNKKAGEVVTKFGKDMLNVTKTPTGVPEIDDLLGGGLPRGRVYTIWGDKGCGKTTLALVHAANCQKAGLIVYYIALEELDKQRAVELGVNLDELIIGKFPVAEKSLDSIIKFAREQVVDVIILDSIHSLAPEGMQYDKKGKEKSMSDDTMALLARKLSQFFSIACHPLGKGNIDLFLIGQTRTALGFITLDKLTGGNALLHYSKLILHMRHGQGANAPKETQEDEHGDGKTVKIGFECVLKIERTQIYGTKMELTEARFPFYYNGGFVKKDIQLEQSQEAEANAPEDAIVDEEIKKPDKVEDKDVIDIEGTVQSETKQKLLTNIPKKKRGRGRPRKDSK